MTHIPILRGGEPYYSLSVNRLEHVSTGEPIAEISQANSGLIARDIEQTHRRQRWLGRMQVEEILGICRAAAQQFSHGELPLGDETQTPDDYIRQLSATTGMPQSLARANMAKIHYVLHDLETVLSGLTRGLDLSILDPGYGHEDGRFVSFLRETDSLGVVLPSNSPGVHSLWIPSIPLKVPLVLKPGAREPWTPYRICQALIKAGLPPRALGYYPADHSGATRILLDCGRSMVFGDKSTVEPWLNDERVQIHGPGWSKVILGEDQIPHWEEHLDLILDSIASNGGRSCINASGLWVPVFGRELAETLAERMARIEARPLDDPQASIAAFSDPRVAHAVSQYIDQQLAAGGAEDLTAQYRGGDRLVEVDGCTFLLPTLIWCEDPAHALAEAEFLFPFVSVVEVPQDEMLEVVGPSLVVTALTENREFIEQLLDCPKLERLNIGPLPTSQVAWDQPHEGSLFELLYRRRALQGPNLPPVGTGDAAAAG
jgi:acyl-CoA reductase-like NAD-dependent aldehyde dehydrogenase